MSKANLELKVGLFVLIGLVILTGIIFTVSDIRFSNTGYTIKIRFDDVAGIESGSPVDLAGVEVGKVESIAFVHDPDKDDTVVELTLWIKKGTIIRKNSVPQLRQLGFLGEQYVYLSLGTKDSPVVEEGYIFHGETPIGIEDLTKELYVTTRKVNRTVDSLNDIIGDEKVRTDLKHSAANTREITEDLKEMAKDLKKHPWKLFVVPESEKESNKKDGHQQKNNNADINKGYMIEGNSF